MCGIKSTAKGPSIAIVEWHSHNRAGQKEEFMSDLKDKTKEKIDGAAKATKDAAGKAVDKSKDLAHKAGNQMEQGAKKLKGA